jgi:hypothetical protein
MRLSVLFGIVLLLPRLCFAQTAQPSAPMTRETYVRAVMDGRYEEVIATLRADLARHPDPVRQGALAQVLLLAGHTAAARAVATECQRAEVPAVAAQCQQVMASTAPVPALPTAVTEPPVTPVAPPPVAPSAPPVQAPRRLAPHASRLASTWRPAVGPVVTAGVGAGSLAVAAVLLVLRDDALAACSVSGDTARCPTQDAMSRARSSVDLTTAANVALAAGLTGIAAGAVWYMAGGREVAVVPTVTAHGLTVTVGGSF